MYNDKCSKSKQIVKMMEGKVAMDLRAECLLVTNLVANLVALTVKMKRHKYAIPPCNHLPESPVSFCLFWCFFELLLTINLAGRSCHVAFQNEELAVPDLQNSDLMDSSSWMQMDTSLSCLLQGLRLGSNPDSTNQENNMLIQKTSCQVQMYIFDDCQLTSCFQGWLNFHRSVQ